MQTGLGWILAAGAALLLSTAAATAELSAATLNDAYPPHALDAQACNTECQDQFTDCMLSCDGKPQCHAQCKNAVEECVNRCQTPAPSPSGSVPAPVPSGGGTRVPSGSPPAAPPT